MATGTRMRTSRYFSRVARMARSRVAGTSSLKQGTPITNLYLSLLDRMGVEADKIGDSTGEELESLTEA